jgi:DNA gyrase subunit A
MELGTIRQINIETEMQASYLDYAMSVIVARALPDVRDGLKPVHRRILYAMYDLGLLPDRPYKKSARIVGEVLGKYHPHGDVAVYEAMVRMAQDFSLRYPLVDGQGNFGSIDGDNAAAMRYTEARLAKSALEMLADIEKDTVNWSDNFDGTLKEPTVLPAALPNLLVNGGSGIAVGMATNIPPHNLNEVCDALCYLIDRFDRHDDVTVEDLMQFIPGPDFPTGGVIYRFAQEGSGDEVKQVDTIAHAYAGGKGSIVMQAKAHIEEMTRNRARIVVTELPYMANKTNLLERIAELVREGRLEGITDLRDESDRTGMRICIEMTRTVEPRQVLADLFKLTPLQTTFGVSLLALVDGEPRLLSLKRLLLHFIEHRQEVIVRRANYDLEKARLRGHILEGLLRALDVLDEVIALIRKSRTADTAKQNLIEQFKFTEIQAQAILDMQLRRLAALERRKLEEEYREIKALIKELEALLASPKKVLALIKQNLLDLKARYGDARRTQIAERVKGALTALDVLPDEDVWVTLAVDGALARWRRSAEGLNGAGKTLLAAAPLRIAPTNTRHDLYLFSAKGQAGRIHVHQIPETPGSHYADLSGLTRRDRVAALLALPKPDAQPAGAPAAGFLLLATLQGKVKRVALADFLAAAAAEPTVIGLDEGDELIWAGLSLGGGAFLLATADGQAIRFPEEDVRPMGLPAGGVVGIKLAAAGGSTPARRVVAALAAPSTETAAALALVTAAGYAKRTPLADFPTQGRGGQGVVAAKLSDKSGEVAGVALLGPDDLLICGFAKAPPKTVPAADLPEMGRPAAGKPITALLVGEPVRVVYAVAGGAGSAGAGGAERAAPPAAAPKSGGRGQLKVAPGPAAAPAMKSAAAAAKSAASASRPPTVEPPASKSPAPAPEPPAAAPARRKGTSAAPTPPVTPPSAKTTAVSPVEKPARGKAKDEAQQLSLIPPAAESAGRPTRRKSDAGQEAAKPARATPVPAGKSATASGPAKPATPADKPVAAAPKPDQAMPAPASKLAATSGTAQPGAPADKPVRKTRATDKPG